jgi:hypothetical protein
MDDTTARGLPLAVADAYTAAGVGWAGLHALAGRKVLGLSGKTMANYAQQDDQTMDNHTKPGTQTITCML